MSEAVGNGSYVELGKQALTDASSLREGYADMIPHKELDATVELRKDQEDWLERRDIDPVDIPHLTMGRREFDLLRHRSPDAYERRLYGLSQGDQSVCHYAFVDIQPDDPGLPSVQLLVDVTEVDFGTAIDPESIKRDFQNSDPDPSDPLAPESSGGALRTVDIANTLMASEQALQNFAQSLMSGQTKNPFSSGILNGIGVRAGGIVDGQEDAYVWTARPFTRSLELAAAFPGEYGEEICIVRGQLREPANGKAGMAQIDHPEVVMKIGGDDLKELLRIYQDVYHEPNYALTDQQRRDRDELFNDRLEDLISTEAERNRMRADDAQRRRQERPLRAREIPRS